MSIVCLHLVVIRLITCHFRKVRILRLAACNLGQATMSIGGRYTTVKESTKRDLCIEMRETYVTVLTL